MLLAALRDLQWRRRRFFIAMAATGLVLAVSLVGSGLSAAFRNEMTRSVNAAHADRWLVPAAVTGPLTAVQPFPAALAADAARLPGVERADPLVLARSAIDRGGIIDVNVWGVVPGGIGAVTPSRGEPLRSRGDAVADRAIGLHPGDSVRVGGRDLRVVGTTEGLTMFGGTPSIYVTLEDAQAMVLAGEPLATSIVTQGVPDAASLPPGTKAMTNPEVKADGLRVLKSAIATIDFVAILLWVVATMIIASILYLTALERTRDIAVYKAMGTRNRAISVGVALQAVVLGLGASVLSVVIAIALTPLVPLAPEIPVRSYLVIPLLAVVASLAAGLVAMRRAVKVEPALAFGG